MLIWNNFHCNLLAGNWELPLPIKYTNPIEIVFNVDLLKKVISICFVMVLTLVSYEENKTEVVAKLLVCLASSLVQNHKVEATCC